MKLIITQNVPFGIPILQSTLLISCALETVGQEVLESRDSVPLVLTVPGVLETPETLFLKEQMSD